MDQVSRMIGARVRSYRQANGMKLQEFADKLHKSKSVVSKYEHGDVTIDMPTLFDIADVFGIAPSVIVTLQEDSHSCEESRTAEPGKGIK